MVGYFLNTSFYGIALHVYSSWPNICGCKCRSVRFRLVKPYSVMELLYRAFSVCNFWVSSWNVVISFCPLNLGINAIWRCFSQLAHLMTRWLPRHSVMVIHWKMRGNKKLNHHWDFVLVKVLHKLKCGHKIAKTYKVTPNFYFEDTIYSKSMMPGRDVLYRWRYA